MKKVLVIAGPTGVGKTALSIHLAQRFQGEIISGDSMQIYRGLDIGTAKVTAAEAQGVPHYLIDIKDPSESFSVAEFQRLAREKIDEITSRGKLPMIVGGTGLYIQALLYDYDLGGAPESGNQALREHYAAFATEQGNQALWELLQEKDPQAAAKIHFNNQRKVIRALEVLERTGRSILAPENEPQKRYDDFLIGLTTERSLLYQRINERVEQMFAAGLEKEAASLRDLPDSQAAKGIGYREFFSYFAGEVDLLAVKEAIKQDSRRYAKRQLTWFRNRMAPHWVDLVQEPEQLATLEAQIHQWLEG
ncbi:tRNA (adenosine(37)-N6)-dimethylallyltransferase MiaA [Enterococcus asini]|uniref:tRNA (adenosine(37)-N6)-dimethylallyltransferase MiaA n=1 Tax=Enterococcus asini TaxID=57732 RepID=UPI0032E4092F